VEKEKKKRKEKCQLLVPTNLFAFPVNPTAPVSFKI